MNSLLNRGTLIITIYAVIAGLILWFTPAEKTLGHVIKYVFFHVSLSYAGIYSFYLSAFLGLVYLTLRSMKKDAEVFGYWSLLLGRVTIVVWAVSVAISIYAMQLAWGQIILTEPLTVFVLIVLALVVGKELIIWDKGLKVASVANILIAVVIFFIRPSVGRIMHPDDPIGTSDVSVYKIMSMSLTTLTFVAMILFTYWLVNNRKVA
ncbi:hypothetical protein [Desulfuribacillus alkaliarsenatis]|uniref:Uncharacterized protein n=1 Tax=Desulfuribacillus alkaliarsenatis TaxID=766136 RepID=A0A1E5G307_9FIRM|nr:hypothetical protein [Desulfuribacillus alkaliarsenatis]OEF96982.1 hypothetical protein BHF68_05095 [Desulfuribacillus alkaliarsenatis]